MHRDDPAHSEAWNITRAADYKKLKDVDRQRVSQKIADGGTSLGETVAAGGLGFISNVNGLPLPGNVGVNMLGSLLLGTDASKSRGSSIVAWIPKSEVSSNKEALEQVAERVFGLIETNLRDMDLPAPYSWGEIKQWELNSTGYKNRMSATLAGGSCDSEDFYCVISLTGWPTGNAWRQDAIAPGSLGGYPAWRIQISLSYYFHDKNKLNRTELARLPLLRTLDAVSSDLPANYFIYIAPQMLPFKQAENEYRFFPAPMVLREGEALFFVEPEQGA